MLQKWSFPISLKMLNPDISDVETPSWASLTHEQHKLICHAGHIGQTHQADIELENPRLDLAIGLAAVEIAQTLVNNKQTQKNWPEAVKIAVKWMRMIDLAVPVFHLDKFDNEQEQRQLLSDKVMYYQYKERVPYAYTKYAGTLFDQW